jgi:diguanylate cyclase (GGDEF)-like protein
MRIEKNMKMRAIVASIIDMAHRLHIETIAEGVETKEQLRLLMNEGCDCIQGYYFSKPLNEEAFREFLKAKKTWPLSWEDNVVNSDQELACMHDLLDHSGMFTQVCHPEDHTMVYANALTKMVSGHPEKPYKGEKCYEYMLGLNAPCGHCPMHKMGNETEKQMEVDDGEHIFSLTGRYANWDGKKVFIEYGRDVTDTKNAQRRYTSRIKDILGGIPDGQGVFHVDLTTDTWVSSGGNAQNARDMQDMENVDTLIRQIASFVPDKKGQEKFFKVFCRQALLDAYAANHHQVLLETDSYYDDGKIRWSRIIANLIENPGSGHLECIIYGVDISDEKARLEELKLKEKQAMLEEEVHEVRELYSQADRDRRIDFLTGLYNRLDLFETMKKSLAGSFSDIKTMYMLDIDNFKRINDTYGHAVGDQCLKMLGAFLKDYGEKHKIYFYRYGGEEFLGIGVDHSDPQKLVQELLKSIAAIEVPVANKKPIHFTVSIGYTTNNKRYEKMIDLADQAMYLAKKQGKNRVVGDS